MADINLADPNCEPTDEQLADLSQRAFAQVKSNHAQSLRALRMKIIAGRRVLRERMRAEK